MCAAPKTPARKQQHKKPTYDRSDGGPVAAIFFYRALTFVAAADAYVQTYGKQADGWTTAFLLGRALELILKAVLRADGMSSRVLARKQYGHDLSALLQECQARSIDMVDPDISDTAWGLRKLSEAYNAKELEYQERGGFSGPTSTILRRIVHFAIQQASALTLREEVRARLLAKGAAEPGLTLMSLAHYE